MWYPHHIPDWVSRWFTGYKWHGDRNQNDVFLTFDDGPTPQVTDFVLRQLEKHGFKATFFCIGDCVQKHPDIYKRINQAGHGIGNHTMHHINGWKTDDSTYLQNIKKAEEFITSRLFRPPYGRIKPKVTKALIHQGYQVIQWDVISGDFDAKKTPDQCLKALKKYTRDGSIVVFHDSAKAWPRLKVILPEYLEHLNDKGYKVKAIENTAVEA